jgi:hypothetical protein
MHVCSAEFTSEMRCLDGNAVGRAVAGYALEHAAQPLHGQRVGQSAITTAAAPWPAKERGAMLETSSPDLLEMAEMCS